MRKGLNLLFGSVFFWVWGQEGNFNDYYNKNFEPFEKGSWMTVIAIGLHSSNAEDDEFLFQDIQYEKDEKYNLDLTAGYFVGNSIAVGMKFNYDFNKSDIGFINENGDSIRRQKAGAKYVFSPFLRNYIPISKNKRFNIYNDTEVSFGFGNRINRTERSPDDIEKYYEDVFIARLGITPGINLFIVKNFSFEMDVNLIGLEYEHTEKKFDDEKVGTVDDLSFDFKISLLSINFGVAYYF